MTTRSKTRKAMEAMKKPKFPKRVVLAVFCISFLGACVSKKTETTRYGLPTVVTGCPMPYAFSGGFKYSSNNLPRSITCEPMPCDHRGSIFISGAQVNSVTHGSYSPAWCGKCGSPLYQRQTTEWYSE